MAAPLGHTLSDCEYVFLFLCQSSTFTTSSPVSSSALNLSDYTDSHTFATHWCTFWWQVLQLILPLILAPPLPLHTLYLSMYVRISFDSVTTSLWVCFNCHKMHRRRLRRTERKLAHTLIRTLHRISSSLHVQWIKSSIICLSDNPTEFRVQFSGTQVAI